MEGFIDSAGNYFEGVSHRSSNLINDINEARTMISQPHLELFVGRDSLVGIATRYGLDGPGIESRWGQNFPPLSRRALRPTQPPIQCVPGLSRRQSGRGVALTTHPDLAQRLKKEWSFTSTPPTGLRGVFQGKLYTFTFNTDYNIILFIFSEQCICSSKSQTRSNSFSVYYADVYLQLNMFRAFSRTPSGAQ